MSTKTIKCPVDGRLFSTKRALQQHQKEKHGSGPMSGPSAQNSVSRKQKNKKKSSVGTSVGGSVVFGGGSQTAVFSGSDLIGSVKVGSATPQGSILLAWDINPVTLINTRVHEFGQVFSRWRPRKLQLSVIPGAGVFTPGSYAIGWTADPKFQFGDVPDRLRRVLTLAPNLMASFGTPRSLNIPCDTTQKWYLCRAAEGVESDHGMVVCVLAALVAAENITINFKLDWTLEFGSPEVPASTDEVEVYPDPDWIPCFTDSVSTWFEGKKLTFKHKEGGDVVPFIGLRSDMIYKPAKGVTVPYVKADKSVGNVAYIARIREVTYPNGVACFDDEAKAKAYVTKGTSAGILDYVDAGGYTTPALPTFIGQAVEMHILCDLRRQPQVRVDFGAIQAARFNLRLSSSREPAVNTSYIPAQRLGSEPVGNFRVPDSQAIKKFASFNGKFTGGSTPAFDVTIPLKEPPLEQSLDQMALDSSGEE